MFSQHVSCVCVVATLKLSDTTCLKPNSASLEIPYSDENELLFNWSFGVQVNFHQLMKVVRQNVV